MEDVLSCKLQKPVSATFQPDKESGYSEETHGISFASFPKIQNKLLDAQLSSEHIKEKINKPSWKE